MRTYGHRVSAGGVKRVDPHLLAFGNTVRALRKERQLSQEQLAHLAGMHRTIVGFIERGDREVGISKLWPLAEALQVPVAALFDQ